MTLLVLVILGSAMAIGGVHPISVLALLIVSTIGGVLLVWDGGLGHGARMFAPAIAMGLLAAYSAFQALPLSVATVRIFSPANAEIWSRSLHVFNEDVVRGALSLDPGASLVEAGKWATYALVFALSAWVGRRRGKRHVVVIVFVCTVIIALVTLIHGLVGAEKIFGFYTPRYRRGPWHVGPLYNPNNLAGYLNLGIFCGLGLLLTARTNRARALFGVAIALLAGQDIIAASRGGVAVLPIGLVALGVCLFRLSRNTNRGPRVSGIAIVGGTLLFGVTLAVIGMTQTSLDELSSEDTLKISMLSWSKPLIADHWLVGIGRGAYETVFPQYRTYPGNVVFAAAENFPSQWLSEWGIPVGAVALAGLLWMMRPRVFRATKSALGASLWCGLLVVLVQNLFDLAFEVPGVCTALAATFGAVWGDWARRRQRHPERRAHVEPVKSSAVVVVVLGSLALSIARKGLHYAVTDRDAAYDAYAKYSSTRDPGDAETTRRIVREGLGRHPADPYLPFVGALTAWVRHEPAVLRGIEQSLERALVNGQAHLLLAEVVHARGGDAQARLELRHAVQDDQTLAGYAASLAVLSSRTDAEILEAVPTGPGGIAMLQAAADHVVPDRQLFLLEEASHRAPRSFEVQRKVAERYLDVLEHPRDAGRCTGDERSTCESTLAAQLDVLQGIQPAWSGALVMRARLLGVRGRPSDGASLLAQHCVEVDDLFGCEAAEADLLLQAKLGSEADSVLRDMSRLPCDTRANCAAHETRLGDLYRARQQWGNAMTQYTRASNDEPTVARWIRTADAASALGFHLDASRALESALRLEADAPEPGLQQRLDAERHLAFQLQ